MDRITPYPFLFLLLTFLSYGLCAQNAVVKISVTGIPKVKGQLLVAFYDSEDSFLKEDKVVYSKIVPVTGKTMDVYFKDIKQGVYAVAIIHDANNNKGLDVNFLGIPVEYIGTSNNKRNYFGAPSFSASKFTCNSPQVDLTIELY
ncbi:MAG: hypothetical protein BWY70_01423 [Bacteroidetes bacterium ADurb.Bin408]|nr:MAG: hypothetical protein BWY70_01423 [Bacteroidetes bacterium ADurb.Bin408]